MLQTVVSLNIDNASVQATVFMEDGSTQTNSLLISSTKNASTTEDLHAMIPFCIEAIQDDDKAVLFHTGSCF